MPDYLADISVNLRDVKEKVRTAAEKSGRNFSDVTILAASKTRSPEEISEAAAAGVNVFGENYVQEFLKKYELLSLERNLDIRWHLIGHLQKNKVKYIIGKTDLIHSVDDIVLAKIMDDISASRRTVSNILIEVNVAGEKTKNGTSPERASELAGEINGLQWMSLKGLMAMPPSGENNREYFRLLRELLDDINKKNVYREKLSVLSMGTSGDFETAVEEGATIVRLGTVLFGERHINKRKELD